MKKKLSLIALLLVEAIAEPSVFGAGNLSSDNPYGLSQSERAIVKNRDDITNLTRDVNSLKMEMESLRESIDGLKSIIEGQNATFQNLKTDLSKTKTEISTSGVGDSDSMGRLEASLEKQNQDMATTFNALKSAIDKMSTTLNTVYQNYVPRDELNKHLKNFSKDILTEVDQTIKTPSNNTQQASSKITTDFKSKDNETIYKEAKALFSKKDYDNAEKMFDYLLENNYQPATINYYLGETNYYTQNYQNAVFYFKKSAEISDKSSFMPTLLLHIAISFEKTSDTKNAERFYDALIESFPNSNEAKIGQKNLDKLKKR